MTPTFATLAALATAALVAMAARASRRRRRRSGAALVLQASAGARSLAHHVGASSHLGMDLRLPGPGEGWRRLGSLLGLDQG